MQERKTKTQLILLYRHLSKLQKELSESLADASDRDKQIVLTELAMWSLKNIPKDYQLRGPAKTQVIKAFFGRYSSYER